MGFYESPSEGIVIVIINQPISGEELEVNSHLHEKGVCRIVHRWIS